MGLEAAVSVYCFLCRDARISQLRKPSCGEEGGLCPLDEITVSSHTPIVWFEIVAHG